MKLNEYAAQDATGLAKLVSKGELTAAELTRLAREAHDRVNPRINAVIEFYEDAETVSGSDSGLFHGVPFLRKDDGPSEAGRLQERGSRLFKGYRAGLDSYFMRRARAAGARIVGRSTTPEFGTSGLSESVLNGITCNPWNLERTAGGSSSGSAAAVAAGIVPIASGGDGGGSIRIPAACCGLVGLNPSRGRISGGPNRQDPNHGLIRNFVLCRSIRDMAAALDVLSGSCPGDPFIIAQPERCCVGELDRPTGRLKIGVATSEWGGTMVEPEIRSALEKTARHLEEAGHSIEEIGPPYRSSDYRQAVTGLSHMGLGSLDAVAAALGRKIDASTVEPVNLQIYEAGRKLPLTHATEIFERLRKIRTDVGEAIQNFDIILTPTMPCTALPHGTYTTSNENLSVDEFMEADAALYQYLGVFNVTGHPSVSLPLFQSEEGMPIGIQIVARFGDETTLVRIGRDLEEGFPWAMRRPPVHAGNAK